MKHSFKEWFIATRPWSFPISSMPVVVTVAFMLWRGFDINWFNAVLAMLGMVIFHFAGNLLSDWWDYRKGVDNEKAYAVPQLVFHQFEPKEYLVFSIVLFAVGVALGLFLCYMTTWYLLILGGVGFLLAANYSFFKYRALGDLFVFTCFSILPMLGTSLVAAGYMDWNTLWVALPLGFITVSVLHDNNTVDIATDSESGIRTIPMTLGERSSAILYMIYMAVPYVVVLCCCIFGALPWWALTSLLSAPIAFANAKAAFGYFTKGREALLGLDQKTAQMHMIFSLTLSAGLLIAAFV